MQTRLWVFLTILFAVAGAPAALRACSVLYYFDEASKTTYVANNEDYWLDQKVVLRKPRTRDGEIARIWYGWDDFAQGGVNAQGLFLDGAVVPDRVIADGLQPPNGNLGDRILAQCQNVEEALALLETEQVGLKNAQIMLGDATGRAVVVECDVGGRQLAWIEDGHLAMTNFGLSGDGAKSAACPRYRSIEERIEAFAQSDAEASLLIVGNFLGGASQPPRADGEGRLGGTLYSIFIDLKDLQLVFVPKLDSSKAQKFDLKELFSRKKGKTIRVR